jgi:hypothetical protein
MSVIAKYKTKLTEHINEKIYNKLIEGLDNFLKSKLEQKYITGKIVQANVDNFKTLIDEKSDKSLKTNYTNLLKLGNICKAEKVADAKALAAKAEDAKKKADKAKKKADITKKEEDKAAAAEAEKVAAEAAAAEAKAKAEAKGGSTLIHKKTHTRKSNKKKRERKTRRIRGGFIDPNNCINVEEICKKVTSLITNQNKEFMNTTEIELRDKVQRVTKLKTQIENICLEKTNEILDQIAEQAIDYGALNEILKYLIVEMTNLVKSNMRNSKDFLCKNV